MFNTAPIVFPYIAKITFKYLEKSDNEELWLSKEIEVAVDIKFRKNKDIVVIMLNDFDQSFDKCTIKLVTPRNNITNTLVSYLIIKDLNFLRIHCRAKETI
jgi:hypothetical protein